MRFNLINKNGELTIKDNKNKIKLNKPFNEGDYDNIIELINYLNEADELLNNITEKYMISQIQFLKLKEKIIISLMEEIKDCEILIKVDKYDDYTQGRLIELHNLLKILL